MKIIFLAVRFPPMDRTKYLYSQLVAQLDDHGHDITVVAPVTQGGKPGLQIEDGITFIRVQTMRLFGVGMVKKGVATLKLPYQFKNAIKEHTQNLNFDLVISPTPPITLYNTIAWLKAKSNAKVYLILRDIFPQNAVDLKLMKNNGLLHRFFSRQERQLYKISDVIGCMSPGNINFIKRQNPELDPVKLQLLPNWGDMVPLECKEVLCQLKKKHGLEDKFICIFGGNIGLPQKIGNLVDLANACADIEDIVFLVIGQGTRRKHLEQRIKTENVKNIILKENMPSDEYFKMVQLADIGLVSLSEDFTIPNIPSKALAYYNAKIPILASIDRHTDFSELLKNNRTGLWAEAGNTDELKKKLVQLYSDRKLRNLMGENGNRYMEDNLTSEISYNRMMNQIEKS